MKGVLAVDVDSTIYNPQPLYSQAAAEIFGEGYLPEEVTHYHWLEERYGPDFWEIFNRALHPDWMNRREIYPNCIETLTCLRDEYKVGIHFITHNIHPRLMRKPLLDWLRSHFGDVSLSITSTGNKVPIMNRVGAFGIVEDKYEALLASRNAGLYGCGVIQPHNEAYILSDSFDYFHDWYTGQEVLEEAVKAKLSGFRTNLLTHLTHP